MRERRRPALYESRDERERKKAVRRGVLPESGAPGPEPAEGACAQRLRHGAGEGALLRARENSVPARGLSGPGSRFSAGEAFFFRALNGAPVPCLAVRQCHASFAERKKKERPETLLSRRSERVSPCSFLLRAAFFPPPHGGPDAAPCPPWTWAARRGIQRCAAPCRMRAWCGRRPRARKR